MSSSLLPSVIHLSLPPRLHSSRFLRRNRSARVAASSPDSAAAGIKKRGSLGMDFPYLSPSHRDLMVDLLSSIDARLGPQLLPSTVPAEVRSFQNETGTSQGALDIRSGKEGSTIDFILESWIHCQLPFGVLDITTLFAFLNARTDSPHLLMEFIQNSESSLVLIVDLLPRRDLVLYPEYLEEFYEHTQSDKPRQELENIVGVQPYRSTSLFIRSVLSPTAIALSIHCESDTTGSMEVVMRDHVSHAAKEIVRIWLDKCVGEKDLGETERVNLLERDSLIKSKAVEIDLASNLPRLFGTVVTRQVVEAIQKAFKT